MRLQIYKVTRKDNSSRTVDINKFAKNVNELETLIRTVIIYSQHVRTEFDTEKNCIVLII